MVLLSGSRRKLRQLFIDAAPYLFPGDLHQAERGHVNHGRFDGVLFQLRGKKLKQLLLILFFLHADEIHEDDAGQVAQAQLSRDLQGGLPVDQAEGVARAFFACVFSGIDVDDRERLRGFDDQIAAAFQPDPFAAGFPDLRGKAVEIREGDGAVLIQAQGGKGLRAGTLQEGADLFIQGRIVGEDLFILLLRRVPDLGEISALRPVQTAVAGPRARIMPQR